MVEQHSAAQAADFVPLSKALAVFAGIATGLLAGLLVLVGLVHSCEGIFWTASAQRIHHWFETKRKAASAIPSPRIILLGGSNAFYGIRASQLASETGLPVLNFGTHGGVPSEFLFHETERIVRPGDLVLYVPEYSHFFIHPRRANTETIAFLLGESGGFLQSLPAEDYLHFLMTTPSEELLAPWLRNRSDWRNGMQAIANEYREVISAEGDYLKNRPEDRGERERNLMESIRYIWTITRKDLTIPGPESELYLRSLIEFRDALRSRGATLLFTWANTIHFPAYESKETEEILGGMRAFMEREGIPVVGNARDAMRPKEEFFDSIYHLDSEGAQKRTRKLAADLLTTLDEAGIRPPPAPR